jgi:hypothetical protein
MQKPSVNRKWQHRSSKKAVDCQIKTSRSVVNPLEDIILKSLKSLAMQDKNELLIL